MPKQRVGDIDIYYEVHGDGPQTLVMVRGLGSNLCSWYEQTPVLARHFRTVVFDNRGAGRTDKPDAPYSMRQMAAEMAGASEEAFARTTAFLRERKQFGKAIGEFQALQHRAAHLYCELEVTRSAVIKALQTLDDSFNRAGAIVSVAKARAGLSATLALNEAVQMHGGIGMTDEFDIGLFMKRVRVCQELFGDSNFHADRLARLNRY
jgi:hypothetical protein